MIEIFADFDINFDIIVCCRNSPFPFRPCKETLCKLNANIKLTIWSHDCCPSLLEVINRYNCKTIFKLLYWPMEAPFTLVFTYWN